MKKKTLWLAETAAMLASLIILQAVTKPAGQLVTGTAVNGVLGIATLIAGVGSGAVVALLSPVAAFLLGIAPQVLTVPAIMAGNLVFVWLLHLGRTKSGLFPNVLRCGCAAVGKFAVLHILVAQVICRLAAEPLLESGMLKPPMLQALPATFTWPQLITALLGGGIALWLAPLLRKALHR